jgi:AraC-like DNA-binding protein/DNA-binding response OmpR family regulator
MQVYNPRLDLFSNYTKEGNKIKTNKVTSLYYAKGNKMLIGTAEGLCVMNISTSEMENLTGNSTNVSKFTNSYITQVFEDSRGLYWIGTREGVNVLNTITDVLNQLTEKQGLCNNNICGIAEDKNGNVWLTTSNGVCRVVVQRNPDENYNYGLYNYNTNDGLQGEEFNSGAIITLSDGNVAMGGPFGMNVIRRSTIIEKGELPPVVLTQLFIKEEEILVGHKYDGRVVLPVALNESSRIVLSNDQNTITIKFAAGSYNQSERLQFSYQLEGYRDKEWRNGDAAKHGVTFNDLPWGTYKLHVKAISAEGNVSGKERIIEIEIETPWYLQIWMLVIYALVIIALIYVWKKGYDQMRAMWKRKKTIINELSYMREEIKLASDELKQPMSRMTSIIMNLAERNESLEGREQLNNLHAQMLEVITRVSDMQSALEHPEESTKKKVDSNYLLEGKGELELPNLLEDELASAIKPHYAELPTSKFRVIFIDNNEDFVRFITSKLMHIYDFHPYADAQKAADDIESMQPDLVVCKHNMPNLTGSELCDHIKMHPKLSRIKFVLMTDTKLSSKDMMQENITMGADDYLAKPFNLQEAITRFNKLLGIGPLEMNTALIEGAETRMLENINSSMTTATESIDWTKQRNMTEVAINDEYIETVTMRPVKKRGELQTTDQNVSVSGSSENYSMADSMDQKLLNSIEQYVQQNMGRGTIDLEKMAEAMRMGMKPFFEKVKDITGKTPAEVVRDIRLKYACVLLQRTNINMSELASHVGFATGEHFINIFKDRFGISPSEYRQKYRK